MKLESRVQHEYKDLGSRTRFVIAIDKEYINGRD